MKPVILAISLSLALVAAARSDTPAEALARLSAAVKQGLESHASDTSPQNQSKVVNEQQCSFLLAQIQSLIAGQDFERAEELLNQTMPRMLTTEEEQKAAANLVTVLRSERETKQNARAGAAEAALKRAADAVRSAKEPKELDSILADLDRYHDQTVDSRTPDRIRAVLNRMRPAHQFVQYWQDYLTALKAGNEKEAQNALRHASNEQGADLIPRSEIADQLEKLSSRAAEGKSISSQQIDDIVGRVKGPDGLNAAIAQLQGLRGGGSGSSSEPLINTISALSALERIYSEFQAGLPFKFDAAIVHVPSSASTKIPSLEAQVLLVVLPRYLKVASDLQPKPGETVEKYLNRMVEEGKAHGDIHLIIQAQSVQRWLVSGNYTGYAEGSPGIAAVAAGQNQEAAGQYVLAIVSYENALRSGDEAVPIKQVEERLAALKSAHPQDFDQAMATFLTNGPKYFNQPGFRPDAGMQRPERRERREPELPKPAESPMTPPAKMTPPGPVTSPQ